jgi:signal transduction histidine kinase/ligand-binding sensor domain-containing protein
MLFLKKSGIILFILLNAGCWQTVGAQVYTKARTLTTENGLSDNSVNCFYKDATGYMWIGTRHGLNQFNGHAFKVFTPAAGNSISNEYINSITGEADGTIWVATMNGLNYYKPTENKWNVILPGEIKNKADLPNNLVWDIQFGQDGLLWIASDVFEFSSYNTGTQQFTYYDWPAFAKTLSATGYSSIQKFIQKSRNEFWLGTTKGLVLLDINTKQFKWIGAGYNSNVSGLTYDAASKKVFVSVDEGKCFAYDEKEKTYREVFPEAEPYPSTAFVVNRYNEIWLPSPNGLLKISEAAKWSRHIAGFSESLLPGAVKSIYKDDMGLRWIGTTNGVAIYDRDRPAAFIPLLPVSEKSANNKMGGVCFDANSNSYFVCSLDPAAVFIVPADGGNIRKITADAYGKTFSNCNNIHVDRENNCWLLTDRNVYRFDRAQQEFVLFPTPNNSENVGFRIFNLDEKGDYWMGTFMKGIYHYRVKEKRYDSIPFIFLPYSKKIASLHFDTSRKSMWISAFSSDVVRYSLETGFMEGYEDRPGLAALNMVNDIMTDHRGRTWMATATAGIFRFDKGDTTGKNFRHFDMQSGLPGNSFMSFCEDGNGNFWLLSERGIDVIDSSGKPVYEEKNHHFGFSNYTSDTRSPHNLFYNKTKNEVVAAVGGGLLIIPVGKAQQHRPFKVLVTNILAGNRDTAEEKSTYELSQRLPYHYNLLHFDFAGLYYSAPDDILYEYKMSGYDKNWTRSNNYSASYQNLPAGNYFFQVRARYRNGQMAGESKGFAFDIAPPFWKTNLFIAAAILLICSAIGWLIYSLMQKLKAEKIVNAFTTSLYAQSSIEDICWDTARNCCLKLGFTDCVIYWYEEDRKLLVQKAAYGPKNPWQREIYNSLAIPLGKGIVGSVALTGKMEVIKDTSKDARYIVDDEQRLSEITVPIFIDEKLFGVIDSEHPQRNFYSRYHAKLLRKIASICAERIARYQAEEKLRGKIARDLHDEMGSTLTSINIMSKVAMEGMPANTPVKDYLQKIKDNSGRILESIGDMVWVINPANDNFEKLVFRMKEFTGEMLEPLKINYRFHEEGILQAVQLNVEQRKEIYMIFKEAVTNAAKYSDTAELYITLSEGNGLLSMEITDKGHGFDLREAMQGNGLKNMKARAAQIGATLHIESVKGRGTTIIFNLPSPHQGMIS